MFPVATLLQFLRMVGAERPAARMRAFCVAVCGAATSAIAYFDLGPPLSFNDDWVYAWSARHLALGRGLHSGPEQSAAAIVHPVWGVLVTLGHPDQRLLRLSILPLAVLGAYCAFRLARRLGADEAWAWLAAAALMTAPLFMSLATSYMTDAPFAALLLALALASTIWIQEGRLAYVAIALAVLATLERQTAAAVAPAVTIALIFAARHRAVGAQEWICVGAIWMAVVAAFALPLLVFHGDTQASELNHLAGRFRVGDVVRPAFASPGPVGLFAIPFLGALGPAMSRGRRRLIGLILFGAVCATMFAALLWIYPAGLFYGDYLTPLGLGPPHVNAGAKVALVPPVLWVGFDLLAALAFIAVLGAVRTFLARQESRATLIMILILGLAQTAPTVLGLWDRYYIPLGALIVPLCAAAASTRSPSRGQPWAVIAVAAALVLYVAGEQDYQAWQVAREQAAHLAYSHYPPSQVDAGYEANGVYVTVPVFEQNGLRLPGAPSYSVATTWKATDHPCAQLAFAHVDDRRPGVSYWSVAPGRIVVVPLMQPPSAGCRATRLFTGR